MPIYIIIDMYLIFCGDIIVIFHVHNIFTDKKVPAGLTKKVNIIFYKENLHELFMYGVSTNFDHLAFSVY